MHDLSMISHIQLPIFPCFCRFIQLRSHFLVDQLSSDPILLIFSPISHYKNEGNKCCMLGTFKAYKKFTDICEGLRTCILSAFIFLNKQIVEPQYGMHAYSYQHYKTLTLLRRHVHTTICSTRPWIQNIWLKLKDLKRYYFCTLITFSHLK